MAEISNVINEVIQNGDLSVSLNDMSVEHSDQPLHQQGALAKLMHDLEMGTYSLLDLIEAMEGYIVSKDEKKRKKSIGLLSYSLIEIPHLFLEVDKISLLADFFIEKLKDVVCVLSSVKALYAILKFHH